MLNDLERVLAIEDVARVALRAGTGDYSLGIELECVGAADDGRNPELPRYYRRVTGPASLTGDDEGGFLHHRLPVGGGHLSDQHVPILKDEFVPWNLFDSLAVGQPLLQGASSLEHFFVRVVGPYRSGANPLAYGLAGGEHGVLLEPVDQRAIHLVSNQAVRCLAVHCLGPGLNNVQATIGSVLGPFYVHRHPIVMLDSKSHVRQKFALL